MWCFFSFTSLIIAPINDIFLVSIFFQTTSKHYNNMKISIKAAVLMLLITDFLEMTTYTNKSSLY